MVDASGYKLLAVVTTAAPQGWPASADNAGDEVCWPALSEAPLGRPQAEALADVLRAIAEPARLQLISLIQATRDGEACVCDLTAPLGLGQPTVSHHLKVLRDAGLVTRTRRGSWAYYRLVPQRLAALAQLLV
jgi:ArsR family transcriptional regulator